MTTFVLVHGAWRGGWSWKRMRPLLAAAGHEVFTPSLTGCGERAHLLTRDTDLDTHIDDVVNLFKYEEIEDAVLVGHSYAGMVVTGVADRIADRIRAMVYVDAFVPADGDSLLSRQSPERREIFMKGVREQGDGWLVPFFPAKAFGALTEADAEWIDGLCVQHPLKSMAQPLHHSDPLAKLDNLTYIRAERYATPIFDGFAAACEADPKWRVERFECGHDVMVDMPNELAAVLLEVAAR